MEQPYVSKDTLINTIQQTKLKIMQDSNYTHTNTIDLFNKPRMSEEDSQ